MKIVGIVLGSIVLLAALAGGAIAFVFFHYGRDLPDHNQLAAYEPPVMTRVHAGDGRLLAEHAREKRLFVPVNAMPQRLVQAFLAAEDKAFYQHFGVDPISVANAVVTNLVNMVGNGDRRPVGASTVTQQVAKNFLLSNELSFSRKIKEAILAMRIEDAFTKDQILELYLNEIYLGAGSYGVAAAALNYFDRSLNDLSLEEIAYLAALPKAPNNYHPVRKRDAAVARRNWVLSQMLANGAVGEAEAEAAMQAPLRTRARAPETFVEAPHFSEEVRRWLQARYGDDTLYEGGLSVRTTVDPALQATADRALRGGLVAYDRRRGWRGPHCSGRPGRGLAAGARGRGAAASAEAVAPRGGAGGAGRPSRDRLRRRCRGRHRARRPHVGAQGARQGPSRARGHRSPPGAERQATWCRSSPWRAGRVPSRSARFPPSRAPWWRSTRTPGGCWRWSAASTSPPASSTARLRRGVSRAPPSSRSSTWRRSITATRRPPSCSTRRW